MASARLTRLLAAVFTPAVALSSAHELYLRNQQDFEGTVSVLHPFWLGAAALAAVTLLAQRLDRRAVARAALWACYAVGFAFIVWSFLRALPLEKGLALWTLDTAAGALVFVAAAGAATVIVSRRVTLRRIEPALALLAAAFASREALVFTARMERWPAGPPRDLAVEVGPGREGLPNVYHLILDSFQDELFEPCVPPGRLALFDGFVRFHVVTRGAATVLAIPDVFGAQSLAAGRGTRIREGLAGDGSLLPTLRRAGYRTVGLVPRSLYDAQGLGLDVEVLHDQNARAEDVRALHVAMFRGLWLYRTLPLALAGPLARGEGLGLSPDLLRLGQGQRLSVAAQPVVSRMSFEAFLETEPLLPARGRYTLVHLLLPHNPYLLRSDCSRSDYRPTDLRQQTDCTLALLTRFLERLATLGRLDPSIVVVHGDHGAGEILRGGRLEPDETASLRTILLVKARGAHGPLRAAPARARLVDIAPTLLALAGVAPSSVLEGRVLE